jgi:hypothetical protein
VPYPRLRIQSAAQRRALHLARLLHLCAVPPDQATGPRRQPSTGAPPWREHRARRRPLPFVSVDLLPEGHVHMKRRPHRVHVWSRAVTRPLRDRSPTVAVCRASRCPHDRRPSRLLPHWQHCWWEAPYAPSDSVLYHTDPSKPSCTYVSPATCLLATHACTFTFISNSCMCYWKLMLPTVVRLLLMHANSAEFNSSCLFAAVANHHHHRLLSPCKIIAIEREACTLVLLSKPCIFVRLPLAGDDITVTSCSCGN